MSRKRKHALDKKNDILKHLEKGERLALFAKEENVGRATVHDMLNQKDEIESLYKRDKTTLQTLKRNR